MGLNNKFVDLTTSFRKVFRRKYVFILIALSMLLICTCYSFRTKKSVYIPGYDFIENGMTQAEVEQLLRVPAGDYTTIDVETSSNRDKVYGCPIDEVHMLWKSDEYFIGITFDQQNKVTGKNMSPVHEKNRGWPWNLLPWNQPTITGGILKE